MDTFYHGSSVLFDRFDLSHALEGDGKVKFGYGVYVTSKYTTAAHYAFNKNRPENNTFYVYTVEIPNIREDNHIDFHAPVHPMIRKRAEEKLGGPIPENVLGDAGKDFRKYLAKKLTGNADFNGEKAAAAFLDSIGVDFITWPVNWKSPDKGDNRAVLNAEKVKITRIEQVLLDDKHQLVEGSQKEVKV